nr:immunoglobulin heavy chain junction region [Macaca mulatta]MOV38210.1 immunoglobulin heavy chain junction region [Macaca mulatta]MOV38639.1 immunoglobulin heavy chain junction region [Macaca mulatta]MOV39138.1 immunoglobulin heavy chain junction region [Macaca mulatta]MOV39209.1 immunoglobulin heavy chain junction region [Macaca mulatta]
CVGGSNFYSSGSYAAFEYW